jgi:hypothetical protein
MDPLEAADIILDRASSGKRLIHTHPELSKRLMVERAGDLVALL